MQHITRSVVSAIIEKHENGVRYIYLQTRWKPHTSPTYSGLLEIPAGEIIGYEDVISALKREVHEETGLHISRIINSCKEEMHENISGNKSIVFRPFICQQMLSSNGGLPWIGFVFRCETTGIIHINASEAKDPKWVSVEKLKIMITKSPQLFFPLQFPVLKFYLQQISK